MERIFLISKDKKILSPLQQPSTYFPNQPPPSSSGFNLNNKVSPSILITIIILSIIFFISGFLHLLLRFLWKPITRNPDELDSVTALQGQLQQLFNLHDSGVDQSFIDTLPVFNYKSIVGLKDPFDCAVCLCEFEGEDELRLLPNCSHAFHLECIDTWLLSNSTCPLCRDILIPDFPPSRNCSPLVLVLDSSSTEASRENHSGNINNEVGSRVNSQLSNDEFIRMPFSSFLEKSCEIEQKETEIPPPPPPEAVSPPVERVVAVKLGNYRNVDSVCEGSSTNNIDSRRCFSMGSFAYVMDENACLQVSIKPTIKKQAIKKHNLPLTQLHRAAMSECSFGSNIELNGFDPSRIKRESFSFSKTWIDRQNSIKVEPERRAFSFRFPLRKNVVLENEERRAASEIGFEGWKNNGMSELGCEDELQSCYSLDSQATYAPSFARRTMIWLMGRPNKVIHSDPSANA